jgi:hypothetical protein
MGMGTVCGLLPSRLACMIVPPWIQYRLLPFSASPAEPTGPVAMGCGLLPSRLARMIVPLPEVGGEPAPWSAQYRLLSFTATPAGLFWLVAMGCGLLPSRLALKTFGLGAAV